MVVGVFACSFCVSVAQNVFAFQEKIFLAQQPLEYDVGICCCSFCCIIKGSLFIKVNIFML